MPDEMPEQQSPPSEPPSRGYRIGNWAWIAATVVFVAAAAAYGVFAMTKWAPGGRVALVTASIALGIWILITAGLMFASVLAHLQPGASDWTYTFIAGAAAGAALYGLYPMTPAGILASAALCLALALFGSAWGWSAAQRIDESTGGGRFALMFRGWLFSGGGAALYFAITGPSWPMGALAIALATPVLLIERDVFNLWMNEVEAQPMPEDNQENADEHSPGTD